MRYLSNQVELLQLQEFFFGFFATLNQLSAFLLWLHQHETDTSFLTAVRAGRIQLTNRIPTAINFTHQRFIVFLTLNAMHLNFMNKAAVRSNLFLIAFMAFGFATSAQKKSYTDYYFEAKTLTDTLNTYQILIQAHGETFPFVSNDYVKNEVARSFNFLNIKKPVDKDPDFVIKIVVSDINADVDYTYKENNTYDIIWVYVVSFALSFEKNEKSIVFIPLCTKKHFEKRFPYSEGKSLEFDPEENRFQITKPNETKPVGKYVDELNVLLNTKATFVPDFNDVLVAFRKKK